MKHPFETLKFCPRCGSIKFGIHSPRSRHCEDCGLTYYANASAAVAAIIRNEEGELLVIRRALEPAKGTLDLPGGFCDPGESAEEALRREVAEETGLQITAYQYLGSHPNIYQWQGIEIHTLDLFFECRADASNAHAADDAAECMWMKKESVDSSKFGMNSVSAFMKEYLNK